MESYKHITAKWEFNKKDKAFIDYCIDNNYEIIECKQYQSKTKWTFKVNNIITETWETQNDTLKFDKEQLDRYIKIRLEVESLRNLKGGI